MSLELTINGDIKTAMLAKDADGLRALRAIKAAILLAKTSEGKQGDLTEDEEMKLLVKLAKQRKESIDIFTTQNRPELAAIEIAELAVIEKFLPKQLDEAELKNIIQIIITQVGATQASDMGKVMGIASKQLAGKADGKIISSIVKELLA
jgi:uncharacterized protein YqeY